MTDDELPEKDLPDRVQTLKDISGLSVTFRHEKGQNVFVFYHGDQAVKECFTYPKAKLYAEGVAFGRKLT